MNFGAEISQALAVCIAAIFTQNILLAYFLGLCPFIGVSREVKTAFGLGLAVIFVMTTHHAALNWLAYRYVLEPLGVAFFPFHPVHHHHCGLRAVRGDGRSSDFPRLCITNWGCFCP